MHPPASPLHYGGVHETASTDGGGRPSSSWASSPAVRRNMQANRGRDTGPEMAVRQILHRDGLRYRVHLPVPQLWRRTIDVAFPGRRIACFIDGCFWHMCPTHFVAPKSNPAFWVAKIGANRERDVQTEQSLTDQGWLVLRFWEHEQPETIAERITLAVRVPDRIAGRDHRAQP